MRAHHQASEPKPLKRYSVPRYPSYEDPDPTLYPTPVPYPCRAGAFSALAGLGLITAGLAQAGQTNESQSASANPFRLSLSGLPHQTSPYGTGQPSYIQDEMARTVINKIFSSEGIKLEKGYAYATNGLAFRADGYNKDLKIGYVFGGWATLDRDAIISWMDRDTPDGAPLTKAQIVRRLQWMGNSANGDLQKELNDAAKLDDMEQLRATYSTLSEKLGAMKLSLAEAQALEKRAEEGKEFIAVISQYDRRFVTSGWGRLPPEELQAEWRRIEGLKTDAEKETAMRALEARMATDGLKALEQAVRQYIRWARSQGLH